MPVNEEKVFELYSLLPTKNRTKIIDKMELVDRCRFTRCSKLSKKEVQVTKNYVFEIRLSCMSRSWMGFQVQHRTGFEAGGFILNFEGFDWKFKTCYILGETTHWKTDLAYSTNLVEYALQEFNNRMRSYQYSVKKMTLEGTVFIFEPRMMKDLWSGIDNLNSLEELEIDGAYDVPKILSLLRRPLKKLTVTREEEDWRIAEFEQIYQVEEVLKWPNAKLNSHQLSRLSAKEVHISIGSLTERDIFQFIRSWQNGTLGRQIVWYSWNLKNSDFDKQKLLRLLRGAHSEERPIKIKHFDEAGKIATAGFVRDLFSRERVNFTNLL